ncbi:MAG TPA: hypothetical protein VNO50_05475 [Pyrinomonadaceae bacterium]|nr:hypothetical protein [Pyrinomonadaceae bacterium]
MTAVETLKRLRKFLLVLALILFAGALIELWLVGHTAEFVQWVAFVLAGAGALATMLVLVRLSPATVGILRVCMLAVALGSLFGIYQHVSGNVAFAREVNPDYSTSQLFWRGLQGGNPLLAPGALVVAALLAVSATYRQEVTT